MGTEVTTKNETSQATPTPEEKELNALMLERAKAGQEGLLKVQDSATNLSNRLLLGESLPGYLEGLPGGLDEEDVKNLVGRSLEDVASMGNQFGILDSGTVQEVGVKTAANIRADAGKFNIQNLLQLLNIGVGGQAQVQAPLLQQEGTLSTQLAGLRSTTTNTNYTQMNPFLKSFQQSAGENIGNTGSEALAAFSF